jgi:periplasmic mercuric ion binding protein
MKKIKNITFIALTSLLLFSCKNESIDANEATPAETTVDTLATSESTANLKTASFSIEGMTCQMGCANAIESKLTGLDGVSDAKVDFENKTAVVKFDGSKQTSETLVKTIEAVAGGDTYKVSNLKS